MTFVVANEARGVRRGGDANNDGVDFRMGSARRASSTRPAESRARPNERAPLEILCAIVIEVPKARVQSVLINFHSFHKFIYAGLPLLRAELQVSLFLARRCSIFRSQTNF